MATHSSVLAWRIPGTEEPGGLPSMGRTESDTTEATQQQQQHSVPGTILGATDIAVDKTKLHAIIKLTFQKELDNKQNEYSNYVIY